MATPQFDPPNDKDAGTHDGMYEEALGEQLLREAREGHAECVAGWHEFMEKFGIHGAPISAKALRETLLNSGINPGDNEFSRGIIEMREE